MLIAGKADYSSNSLITIQALRGVAAVSVVFFHVYVIGSAPSYFGRLIFQDYAKSGVLGINLFFVLSGYIILSAHFEDIGKPRLSIRYLSRRITRIYPVYWIFLTSFIVAGLLGVGEIDHKLDMFYVVASYTLVDVADSAIPPLKVAWTLFYEIRFYAVFLILIISNIIGVFVLVLWLAFIIACNMFHVGDFMSLGSLWNIHFFVGMAAFMIVRHSSKQMFPVYSIAFLVSFGWYIVNYNCDLPELKMNMWLMCVLAPSFGALIISMVLIEGAIKSFIPYALRALGDASYSIYLTHSALISLCFIILNRLHLKDALSYQLLYLVLFVSAILAGVAAYFIVERPVLGAVRSLTRKPQRRQRTKIDVS